MRGETRIILFPEQSGCDACPELVEGSKGEDNAQQRFSPIPIKTRYPALALCRAGFLMKKSGVVEGAGWSEQVVAARFQLDANGGTDWARENLLDPILVNEWRLSREGSDRLGDLNRVVDFRHTSDTHPARRFGECLDEARIWVEGNAMRHSHQHAEVTYGITDGDRALHGVAEHPHDIVEVLVLDRNTSVDTREDIVVVDLHHIADGVVKAEGLRSGCMSS